MPIRGELELLQQDRELHTVLFAKREQLGDRLGRLMRHLRAILEEGKAQGAFDPTISTELMLTLVMNLISFSRRPPIPLPEPAQRSPEELLAQAKRVLFDGIATHPGGEQRS